MKNIFALAIVLLLTLSVTACTTSSDIEDETLAFLEAYGYERSDVNDIEVDHSYINKILGYNEWRIFVEFKSEPDIIFAFTYRNDEIVQQGIKSNSRQLDKDEIRMYDENFTNGELKFSE